MLAFKPKKSSNVNWLSYDLSSHILFASLGKDNKEYAYKSVPVDVYNQLLVADQKGDSVGELFNKLVVKGGYKYEKLK